MRFTSPSRRALGLAAASTIGMSTALLGVTGIASADPYEGPDSFENSYTEGALELTVPDGVCAIDWTVAGGAGDDNGTRTDAGLVETTTKVTAGQVYTLDAGAPAETSSEAVGAPSRVLLGGSSYLVARGGAGSSTQPSPSDNVFVTSIDPSFSTNDTTADTDFGYGGDVYADYVSCPYDVVRLDAYEGNGVINLSFFTTAEEPVEINDVAGFEYRLDNGPWTEFDPEIDGSGYVRTTIPAENDVAQTVTVRTTSTAGPSSGVSAGPVTPYAPIAAPTNLAVTTAPSRVTASWTAPAGVQVTGYSVGIGYGESGDPACTITDPSVTTCTFFTAAGSGRSIVVSALDAQGRPGQAVVQTDVTVPGPATPSSVPTKDDGDITGPAGPISKITAGQKITLQGSGYAPNSTVELLVFSSPVSLGTVVTDSTGSFSVEVTVPANLANGTHHLVATGVDANGNVRNLVVAVTVSGGVATLATTGFDAVPVAVGGGLVLLAGAGLLVGARRRSNV